jgi:ADP-ribose pyrophosphatase
MDIFFYGTLNDADVRRVAFGPGADALPLVSARLAGYRRMAKLQSSAPVLVRRPGAHVDGLLARGLGRRQVARLRHFEGRNYRLVPCKVTVAGGATVPAMVYLGAGRIPVRRAPWLLSQWRRRHKRAFLALSALWMAAYREAGYLTRGRPRWVKRWAIRD